MKKEEGVRNIIIIVMDALRAKNLGCYGYPVKTSPNIDNLAKEGVLFEDAYSCINATDPSLTTIFSGKYPASHGIIRHGPQVTKEDIQEFNTTGTVLLPEILKLRGYTTAAIDWLGRWHRRGYTQYGVTSRKLPTLLHAFYRIFRPSKTGKPTADAKSISNQAINIIRENREKNFLLFIHYWDTHTCYSSPKKYIEECLQAKGEEDQTIEEVLSQIGNPKWRDYLRYCMKGARTTNEIVARYDGAIAFVDHEIGRLIESLKENRILEQTLIILTADHAESLTEHGIYFTHHGLYDEAIHVPLVLRAGGLPKSKRVKGFVQHTDIFPTILDILNVEAESDFDGRSLIPLIHGEVKQLRPAIYVEEAQTERKRAIRTDKYKYIYALSEKDAICRWCERVHGGREELYDLEEDAQETRNILEEQPAVANALKEQLSDWIKYFEYKKAKANTKIKIKKLKARGII